jgi:hypothetical protein
VGCNSTSTDVEEITDTSKEKVSIQVTSSFESGNIGTVESNGDSAWDFYLRNDNNNASLPKTWRNWWYAKVQKRDSSSAGTESLFDLDITWTNRGWPFYYLPVYSYDQKTWTRFQEQDVSLETPSKDLRVVRKGSNAFTQHTVWLARFYPYTFTDLEAYAQTIQSSPYVSISVAGKTQQQRNIYQWKITNPSIADSNKTGVILHARTHPAETTGSFLVEGLVQYWLSEEGQNDLDRFVFYVFPMHNVDGVVAGNYRTTPKSENLENMWYRSPQNPINLTEQAPQEVQVLRDAFVHILEQQKVTIALNLHGSNSDTQIGTFFFPHFGTSSQGYAESEAKLWDDQIRFIETLRQEATDFPIEPNPSEGTGSFATKYFPESWWWTNYKDTVMALTLENTYVKSGKGGRWILPEDLRELGGHLGRAIKEYHEPPNASKRGLHSAPLNSDGGAEFEKRKAAYLGVYPPALEGEGKE